MARAKTIAPAGGKQSMIRFPDGLREKIKTRAQANGRSMNSEIVAAVLAHLAAGTRLEQIEQRLARLERKL